MIGESEYGQSAILEPALLERVVRHKQLFYPSGWARYDLASPESIKLVPHPDRITALRADYAEMEIMFIGPQPDFDDLLSRLSALESRLHEAWE